MRSMISMSISYSHHISRCFLIQSFFLHDLKCIPPILCFLLALVSLFQVQLIRLFLKQTAGQVETPLSFDQRRPRCFNHHLSLCQIYLAGVSTPNQLRSFARHLVGKIAILGSFAHH